MAPVSHEKVAEPSNLQSLRGAISDGRITRTHEPSTRPAVTRPTTQRPWLVTDPHGSEEASVERDRRPARNVDGATPPSAPPARPKTALGPHGAAAPTPFTVTPPATTAQAAVRVTARPPRRRERTRRSRRLLHP